VSRAHNSARQSGSAPMFEMLKNKKLGIIMLCV
jgi:hypothetical protein